MANGKASLIVLLGSLLLTTPACRDSRAADAAAGEQAQPTIALPNRAGTYKFAVLGDFGTGDDEQYEMAREMANVHTRFKYAHVILVGDNLYGSERPQDFKEKFELPYKPLLDAGVKFYASLGNHDAREQRYYKLFNMGDKLYYSFNPEAEVRFFALESTYPTPEQIDWFEEELKSSGSHWKIPFFHHPIYSSGERHGSDIRLRRVLEPLLLEHGVSVVFMGHDHNYERTKPQNGITYFVVGSGGKLRAGGIDRDSGITAKGFDTDLSFLVAEIDGDQMYFNAISRRGQVVDSGVIPRRKPPIP
jgi:3',5'-cyclic AMP phosphodiesterase CpdA